MPILKTIANGQQSDASQVDQLVSLFSGGVAQFLKAGYGAVGDGVTDDTVAVQAALNGGGFVFAEPGTYLCGPLTIPKSLCIWGLGAWSPGDTQGVRFQAKNGINTDFISFASGTSVNGARFANLIFDGNQANQTVGNTFHALGALHCVWENCHFMRHWQNGLYLHQDGAGGTGHHNRVLNCLFDQGENSPGGDGRGLRIEASDENFIYACDFENNGRPGASEPNQVFDLSGLNLFLGCTAVGGQTGIKIQGDRSKIIGCEFDGVKGHNVRLNGSRNLVVANTFTGIGFSNSANTIDGVLVDNVDQNRIAENTFLPDSGGGCRSGVNLAPAVASTNTDVVDNTFSTATGSYGTGPVIGNTGVGNRIAGNRGYNPRGSVTAPGIPASTTALTNNTGYDCMVLVTGGTVTNVALGGTNTGQTSGWFRVPATQTITLTYSVAPTWSWFGD